MNSNITKATSTLENTPRILRALKQVGVPPHILGYKYLAYAVELVLNDDTCLHRVTKELYPAIAKKFKSTSTRVERAIRHGVEVACNCMTPNMFEELFGNTLGPNSNVRPCNSHFIATIVEMVEYGF